MADEVEEVVKFLRNREVDENIIQRFREEKMDFLAVEHTPEHVLIDMGLTRKGDIYTLKAMCQSKKKSTSGDHEREARKRQLIQEIVKEKESRGKRKFSRPVSADGKSTVGKHSAKTRRISLGLMQFDKKKRKYVSVRYSKGGGTRLVDVPVTMRKDELIEEGKALFFQNGECPLGAESDMIFELVNFKGEVVNTLEENGEAKPFTIQKYFEHYKLSKVQLYIAFRPLADEDSDDDELMESAFSPSDKGRKWRQTLQLESKSDGPESQLATSTASELYSADCSPWHNSQLEDERKLKAEQDKQYQESLEIDSRKRKTLEDEIRELSRLEEVRRAREARVPKEPGNDTGASAQVLIVVQHPFLGRISRVFSAEEMMLAVYDWVGSLNHHPEHFSLHVQPAVAISPQDKVLDFQSVVIYVESLEQPLPMSFTSPEVSFKGFADVEGSMQDEWSLQISAFEDYVPPVIEEIPHQLLQHNNQSSASPSNSTLHVENPVLEEESLTERRVNLRDELYDACEVIQIRVSREKILQKLLQTYKTSPDICSAILNFVLEGEQGLDMDGVKREVFTIFWDMAFEKFFEGHTTLVPRVGPDIQDSDYQAIGRAISHSYLLTGIFPVTISKVFVVTLLVGKDVLSAEDYISGLLDHVSVYDSLQLKSALATSKSRGVFSEKMVEFLLEFLAGYGVVQSPTPSSLEDILVSVAKTELIAKPSVAIKEIKAGMFGGKFDKLWGNFRKTEVDQLYDKMRLTTPKVLQMICVDEMSLTKSQSQVLQFLKQYIKCLSPKELQSFLRYVTGSSLPAVDKINVLFHPQAGAVPLVYIHTCSAIIDLPCGGYTGFQDFRIQMDNTLQSPDAWRFTSA